MMIKAFQLLGVKAKWILVLGTILVSLVLTILANLTYDGMKYISVLDEIVWGKYIAAWTLSWKSHSFLFLSTICVNM